MGAKPRHEGIAVECQMRGESVFPATDNRKFIPSIMLDSFSTSFSSLPPSLISRNPFFRLPSYHHDCANHLRAFGIEKRRLLTDLRKRVAKSADLRLSRYSSAISSACSRVTLYYSTECPFASFQVRNTAVIFLSLGFVIPEAFCSLRSDIARPMRIMSVR